MTEHFLSTNEIAALARRTRRTVREWQELESWPAPAVMIASIPGWDPDEVRAWIREHRPEINLS